MTMMMMVVLWICPAELILPCGFYEELCCIIPPSPPHPHPLHLMIRTMAELTEVRSEDWEHAWKGVSLGKQTDNWGMHALILSELLPCSHQFIGSR